MSEELDTLRKLDDCSHALSAWMKSQGLCPADGVMLAQYFTARMIIDNASSALDIERKLILQNSTTRQFIETIQALGFKE